ncbi:hypothetical protein CNECB9_3760107 [Cupriavidus necator]|uniref:Uncharacterized protein n=1 Tax=Cupriavidus necator TaxID=106590 RepID=A0A1K0JQK5_CUPNE|nr:hypothetical protein CNECB9_3760107 [Cupriavidus necator]
MGTAWKPKHPACRSYPLEAINLHTARCVPPGVGGADVRVGRLNDCSDADAIAEGLIHVAEFRRLY